MPSPPPKPVGADPPSPKRSRPPRKPRRPPARPKRPPPVPSRFPPPTPAPKPKPSPSPAALRSPYPGPPCGGVARSCEVPCGTGADAFCPAGDGCVKARCATTGLMRWTLSWDRADVDVDLVVATPSGAAVSYLNDGRGSSTVPGGNGLGSADGGSPLATDGAQLEVDSADGGPESVYWPAEAEQAEDGSGPMPLLRPPAGTYSVCVVVVEGLAAGAAPLTVEIEGAAPAGAGAAALDVSYNRTFTSYRDDRSDVLYSYCNASHPGFLSSSQRCVDGVCEPTCAGRACPAGSACLPAAYLGASPEAPVGSDPVCVQRCGGAVCGLGQACFESSCVTNGRLRFTLTWDRVGDCDLMLTTPFGNLITWLSPRNAYTDFGSFEYVGISPDSDTGRGPENAFWVAAAGQPPAGAYKVCAVPRSPVLRGPGRAVTATATAFGADPLRPLSASARATIETAAAPTNPDTGLPDPSVPPFNDTFCDERSPGFVGSFDFCPGGNCTTTCGGRVCAAGESCIVGQCRARCGSQYTVCDAGQTCVQSSCTVLDAPLRFVLTWNASGDVDADTVVQTPSGRVLYYVDNRDSLGVPTPGQPSASAVGPRSDWGRLVPSGLGLESTYWRPSESSAGAAPRGPYFLCTVVPAPLAVTLTLVAPTAAGGAQLPAATQFVPGGQARMTSLSYNGVPYTELSYTVTLSPGNGSAGGTAGYRQCKPGMPGYIGRLDWCPPASAANPAGPCPAQPSCGVPLGGAAPPPSPGSGRSPVVSRTEGSTSPSSSSNATTASANVCALLPSPMAPTSPLAQATCVDRSAWSGPACSGPCGPEWCRPGSGEVCVPASVLGGLASGPGCLLTWLQVGLAWDRTGGYAGSFDLVLSTPTGRVVSRYNANASAGADGAELALDPGTGAPAAFWRRAASVFAPPLPLPPSGPYHVCTVPTGVPASAVSVAAVVAGPAASLLTTLRGTAAAGVRDGTSGHASCAPGAPGYLGQFSWCPTPEVSGSSAPCPTAQACGSLAPGCNSTASQVCAQLPPGSDGPSPSNNNTNTTAPQPFCATPCGASRAFCTGATPACVAGECVATVTPTAPLLWFQLSWTEAPPGGVDVVVQTPSGRVVSVANAGPSLRTDWGRLEAAGGSRVAAVVWPAGGNASRSPPAGPYFVCAVLKSAPAAGAGGVDVALAAVGRSGGVNATAAASLTLVDPSGYRLCNPSSPGFVATVRYCPTPAPAGSGPCPTTPSCGAAGACAAGTACTDQPEWEGPQCAAACSPYAGELGDGAAATPPPAFEIDIGHRRRHRRLMAAHSPPPPPFGAAQLVPSYCRTDQTCLHLQGWNDEGNPVHAATCARVGRLSLVLSWAVDGPMALLVRTPGGKLLTPASTTPSAATDWGAYDAASGTGAPWAGVSWAAGGPAAPLGTYFVCGVPQASFMPPLLATVTATAPAPAGGGGGVGGTTSLTLTATLRDSGSSASSCTEQSPGFVAAVTWCAPTAGAAPRLCSIRTAQPPGGSGSPACSSATCPPAPAPAPSGSPGAGALPSVPAPVRSCVDGVCRWRCGAAPFDFCAAGQACGSDGRCMAAAGRRRAAEEEGPGLGEGEAQDGEGEERERAGGFGL
ncbi:hypothetical protein HYH03_012710 [Edaphochlamys debaryana]|uniref:Uncharacterized protein n=1 Tax=Edaphochlamys debaryana TaxID=47281 RepID=A0A836BTU2_9CHLO|nr:hypothetical protein HYH03_012710 [Edaphochlamys debaryana]|eukprot:KAG2488710.1 hypothetical protein HYH03_012710 [Edaphochlamys debaryana]